MLKPCLQLLGPLMRAHLLLPPLPPLTLTPAVPPPPTPPCSEPLKFCTASESDLAPFLERLRDPALRHSLQYGVGYCHETMPQAEQDVVRLLFESGAVQVRGRGGVGCRVGAVGGQWWPAARCALHVSAMAAGSTAPCAQRDAERASCAESVTAYYTSPPALLTLTLALPV